MNIHIHVYTQFDMINGKPNINGNWKKCLKIGSRKTRKEHAVDESCEDRS